MTNSFLVPLFYSSFDIRHSSIVFDGLIALDDRADLVAGLIQGGEVLPDGGHICR
jgi:hypothetical protein